MPTAWAPVGNSKNSDPSLPVGVCAFTDPTTKATKAPLKRSRLIDQHDGNIVSHGVAEAALVTKQCLLRLSILELALALWADEDFKETRGQAHLFFPVAG